MDVAEERYLYGPPPTPFSPHNRHKVIFFCTAITLRLPAFPYITTQYYRFFRITATLRLPAFPYITTQCYRFFCITATQCLS